MRAKLRPTLPLASLMLLAVPFLLSCGDDEPSFSDRLLVTRPEGIVELSLATGEERVIIPQQPDTQTLDPAVSPDGALLAYSVALAPTILPGETAELGSDLYIADIDGSDARAIAVHAVPDQYLRWPAWFPGGLRMLVSQQRIRDQRTRLTIETLDVLTGVRSIVTSDALRPSLSPDGGMMAYISQDELLTQALWVSNADGTAQRLLVTAEEGFASFEVPRFSPDGARLLFAASRLLAVRSASDAGERYVTNGSAMAARNGVPMDLWLIDLDGSNLRMLADMNLDSPSVAWSADGERIFVLDSGGLYAVLPEDGAFYRVGEGTFHGQLAWLAAE